MIPRAVFPTLVGLALALPPWTGTRAQGPASPELYVVVLATASNTARQPPGQIPSALRGNPLYWRVLRSGGSVSYQFCLGFFGTRSDAERARRQLVASFREAQVLRVNAQERENLAKASRGSKPAEAAAPPVAVTLPPAPAPVAAPAAAAPATAPGAPASPAEALMAEGRSALVREDYAAAIRSFTQLLESPDESLRRDALEFLALAYERRGDTARARVEYQNYLKRYPEGEDSVRVRQRLTALSAVPQLEALHAPNGPQQGWRSFTSGSLAQFYYRGNSKIDSQQPVVPPNANALDRTTLSLLDQSALISSLDVNARFLNDTHENRLVLRDINTRNFINPQQSINRLDSAYYDYKYKPFDASARVGRQPGNVSGLPGRFDGALAGWGFTPKTRIGVAAGQPVVPGFSIDSDQRFYAVGAELGPFDQRWTGNVYVLRQTVDGIPDRQATGGELRYFVPQAFFSATTDYDTLFNHVNIATVQGNWTAPWKTSFNVLLDYRMTPSLQTTTAIIGEPTTSIRELLNVYTEEELRQRARALTAQSAIAFGSLTHPVSKVWQLGANLTVSRISHTDGTNNTDGTVLVPATPGSGNVYTGTLQVIGTGLFAVRDVTVVSASRVSADAYSGLAAQLTTRAPMGANWTLDAAVLGYKQDNADGSTLQRISPVLRLSYRWQNSVSLELEAGIERTNARSVFLEEVTRRDFYSLGYRWDF